MKAYRVFLSYRGNSEGKGFCHNLYHSLISHPKYQDKYGEIYFSPETELTANFKLDISAIMEHVEYFVMPLTKNYFEDFWDDKHKCPNEESITYLEINAALKRGVHFICVSFPDYTPPQDLIWRIFKEHEELFRCAKPLTYSEDRELEIFEEIKNLITFPAYNTKVRNISELLRDIHPNIFLLTKGETEDREKYPFYERIHGVKHIYVLNFAGTSFINGAATALIYEENNWLKQWFFKNLRLGKIHADVILTNPHSTAAQDAAQYKMYPEGPKTPKDRIISDNLNELFKLKHNYPQIRLNVFLTNISLPYGVMLLEYNDRNNNHMKIDLYSAVLDDDRERPSLLFVGKESKH